MVEVAYDVMMGDGTDHFLLLLLLLLLHHHHHHYRYGCVPLGHPQLYREGSEDQARDRGM